MERGVRVNAVPIGGGPEGDELSRPTAAAGADLGPCLYFGPGGKRCNRRAVEGGFCGQHQPSVKPVAQGAISMRRVVAILAALAALLPWLVDLVRELIRLLR
ncbi:MAG: DUF5763 domain-containing protein [Candidatus Acidiferrales bacterium]|jgi:hypothetical protein